WRDELKLANAIAVDDLVWHRLRYRFSFDGEKGPAVSGTESISNILRRPVVHIIGQQEYLAGGIAAVRAVVTDDRNEPLSGSLRIELLEPGGKPRLLYSGRVGPRGSLEARFRLPPGLLGSQQIHYV